MHVQACRDNSNCSPLLSIVDAGIDLHLPLPQILHLRDGTHFLQEKPIRIPDQDIFVHLYIQAKI